MRKLYFDQSHQNLSYRNLDNWRTPRSSLHQNSFRSELNKQNVRPNRQRVSLTNQRKEHVLMRQQSAERLPQFQIISQNTVYQDGIKKRIISKAMWGQTLRRATQNQVNQNRRIQMSVSPRSKPDIELPNYEQTKLSLRANGCVRFFAANTNQGIQRSYNQDRVSIILNILKPQSRENQKWPKCSFFGLYDGHGGAACADFLRDNLHQFVIKQKCFPKNPKEAIRKGFQQAELTFLKHCQNSGERSGSCALVLLIVGDQCFVANVGDSRAVLSCYKGQSIVNLSRDHKPSDLKEQKRILQSGGKLFLTHCQDQTGRVLDIGPLRIFPGRLSLTRSFGDIQAKLAEGGNPSVLISHPQITSFSVDQKSHDLIILGCDGLFDKLSSQMVMQLFWSNLRQVQESRLRVSVQRLIMESLIRDSRDNITCIAIGLRALS